jgi:hypothetical protein
MPNLRNLLRRPAKPALGNGRVQVGVERALIAHNGGPITTSIAVEWAYALRRYQGKPIKSQHLVYVRRALDRVADRLLQGRPVVALTADTAAIENPATGSITTYRKHNKPALGPLGDSLEDLVP